MSDIGFKSQVWATEQQWRGTQEQINTNRGIGQAIGGAPSNFLEEQRRTATHTAQMAAFATERELNQLKLQEAQGIDMAELSNQQVIQAQLQTDMMRTEIEYKKQRMKNLGEEISYPEKLAAQRMEAMRTESGQLQFGTKIDESTGLPRLLTKKERTELEGNLERASLAERGGRGEVPKANMLRDLTQAYRVLEDANTDPSDPRMMELRDHIFALSQGQGVDGQPVQRRESRIGLDVVGGVLDQAMQGFVVRGRAGREDSQANPDPKRAGIVLQQIWEAAGMDTPTGFQRTSWFLSDNADAYLADIANPTPEQQERAVQLMLNELMKRVLRGDKQAIQEFADYLRGQ